MVQGIIENWGRENLDAAWRWSAHSEPAGLRRFARNLLVNVLLEANPDRALELHMAEVEENPTFTSKVSEYFVGKMATKEAGSFVDVLSKLPEWGPHSYAVTVEFAPDFDFLRRRRE